MVIESLKAGTESESAVSGEGISTESASEESASVFALRHASKVSCISVDESRASPVSPVLFA
ncbi:hypothetical protein CDL15_Pgr018637 [Punica granatum]|uniref:Uncharacterized protein n=1 Tax=Punica granatum TaxID=22663 RepID=A0A218WZR7_PUNGR|nr:hypothetical protein CDL15_Pgr018637 [Punica granatum]